MQPVVLVTGGTGVVGSELWPRLVQAYPTHRVLVVTRGNAEGAAFISGDLCNGFDLAHLQARITTIIHCAANTRFNLPIDESRTLNVAGTRRLLDFALHCPRLEQFAHLSTLYIAGRRPGLITEAPLHHEYGYFNTYEQSKHEAEELVLTYAGRLPVSVYRLSSVVGKPDRRSHFHQVIRLIPWSSSFPVLPGQPDVPVDLIPTEWLARAMTFLLSQSFMPGKIRHLCAGPVDSLTVRELIEMAFLAFEASAGVKAPRPRLAPNSEGKQDAKQTAADRALSALHTFLPHLAIAQPFDPGETGVLLKQNGLGPLDARVFLKQVLAKEFPLRTEFENSAQGTS